MPMPAKPFATHVVIHESAHNPAPNVRALIIATVTRENLPWIMRLHLHIGVGAEPYITRLEIEPLHGHRITTSGLHMLPADQLVKVVVAEANLNSELSTVFEQPPNGRRSRSDDKATRAAMLYRRALESGSDSPTVDVAREMGYSRSQVSRYIRRARELNLM